MIAWICAHPKTAALIVYMLLCWLALGYCLLTASDEHKEPV